MGVDSDCFYVSVLDSSYFTSDSACAATILKQLRWRLCRKYCSNFERYSANAIQTRWGMIVFQSTVIKV